MNGLFGEVDPMPAKQLQDRAHAAKPGTGPAGMTCGKCKHRCRIEHAKVYQKCGLMRHVWSGGAATDIRCKDAACRYFEKVADE
jgi:hypothetical protein